MQPQPSNSSFADFQQQCEREKTENYTFQASNTVNRSSLPSCSSIPLHQNTRDAFWDFTNPAAVLIPRPYGVPNLNYPFDPVEHKKILEILKSDVNETTWTCRECLYTNNAVHINICNRCKGLRFGVISQVSRSQKALPEDQKGTQKKTKDDNTSVDDRNWRSRTHTLSLPLGACYPPKQSISDDIISEKNQFNNSKCKEKKFTRRHQPVSTSKESLPSTLSVSSVSPSHQHINNTKFRFSDKSKPGTDNRQILTNDQKGNPYQIDGDDQNWTCKRCTLINRSSSLSCEACCASQLQSLSISGDITPEKEKLLLYHNTISEINSKSKQKKSRNKKHRLPPVTATAECLPSCSSKASLSDQHIRNIPAAVTATKIDTIKETRNTTQDLPDTVKHWVCPICTFNSSRSEFICDMCKNMRNSIDQPEQLNQEEIAELQWDYIVSNCKINKKLYVDEMFPAALTSLYYSPTKEQEKNIKWVRMRNVIVDEIDQNLPWVVFKDVLEPSDVCQGDLNDCWLLSALSVLVERENLIRSIVLTKQLCPQGIYQIRLCKDGNWTVVTVDDLFPCDKKGFLLYAQAIRKQLWAPLIEKAFSKLNGSYESLNIGSVIEGLATLTGAPCESISLEPKHPSDIIDDVLIWAQLISSRQARFLMGTVSGRSDTEINEAELEKKGLHTNHVYSILDVLWVSGHRLVQLRDPYGEFGSCYTTCSWTPELLAKLPSWEPENGTFWMDFEDILKYFNCIGICKIRFGWHETRLSVELERFYTHQELSCVLLTVYEPTEIDLVLYQNSQREFEISKRTRFDLCVTLLKATGDSSTIYTLITNSKREIRGFVNCYKIHEPAQYIIIPLSFICWHLKEAAVTDSKCVLAIHSSKKVSAQQVTSPPQVLADTIISLALINGECRELLKHFNVYYLVKNFSGAAIVVENKYKKKWVHFKSEADKESYNVFSTRGVNNTVDSIPPLHRQVIAVFTQFKDNYRFFTAHQLDYRIADSSDLLDWGNAAVSHIPIIDYESDGLHVPRLI